MGIMTHPIPFVHDKTPPAPAGKILIVDDELGPRQALNMLLKGTYAVTIAPDVAAGREELAAGDFDLVITDLRMPRESGIELLRHTHEFHRDVQVIILTGYGELDTAVKAVELGAFAYLEKPFDTGEMLGYVERAVARRREILDKMRLEQLALEANRSETLGRVVSGMIHDLGTPLSVINTSLELDLLQPEFEPHAEHLNMLLSQVMHCREIVRSTLGFLRRQAREWDLLSLNDLVETSLQLARPMLRDHCVEVTTDLAAGLPYIRLESILTRQALLNLINNACQAMDHMDGSRRVSVSTSAQDGFVCVRITDSGPGVDPEIRDQIFESFYSTKGPNGTGLGLAVVKNVMHEHGGAVELESSPGQGATFTLRFPIQKPSA